MQVVKKGIAALLMPFHYRLVEYVTSSTVIMTIYENQ